MPINTEKLSRPWFIFIVYVAAAALVILCFRLIFPGEVSPLPVFSRNWRLIRGLLEIITLFPAVAFSALVIPFGQVSADINYDSYSSGLFQRLISTIVTVIISTAVYTLLFFLVLPLAQNAEGNMRFRGEIFRLAKDHLQVSVEQEEWLEASHFIAICDNVWYNSPEIVELRAEVEINLDEARAAEMAARLGRSAAGSGASVSDLPGQREQPPDVTETLVMGRTAFDERRYFDAHWLATLAGRIAREGSPEKAAAERLASLAWNQIESQRPGAREQEAFSVYRLKLSGYEAMVSGDWIRAYYIFTELNERAPRDPDTEKFLRISEEGTTKVAFFIDEVEVSLSETLTGAIFSLPGRNGERSVMRITGFSSTPDYAYGIGIEYMAFDPQARLLLNLQTPCAKFLPITLDGEQCVLVLMRALDRRNPDNFRVPTWEAQDSTVYHPGQAQLILNVSYETFIMLSQLRQGLPGMQLGELFAASKIAGDFGYISQVFEAEILNRLGACFFLPVAVLVIILGLRYRAVRRSRYFFVLMFPVLPVVFNGAVHLYRTVLNIVGISLILAAGFSTALILYIVILALTFLFSLILLASYHSK